MRRPAKPWFLVCGRIVQNFFVDATSLSPPGDGQTDQREITTSENTNLQKKKFPKSETVKRGGSGRPPPVRSASSRMPPRAAELH
jgi:hypothetical protein